MQARDPRRNARPSIGLPTSRLRLVVLREGIELLDRRTAFSAI
jgi:hypothetical protein